jgi:hypothetical protein
MPKVHLRKPPDSRTRVDRILQRQLICPARSRVTLIEGKARATSTKGCECEGEQVASGSRCVPRS